jgi:hypothetical protein
MGRHQIGVDLILPELTGMQILDKKKKNLQRNTARASGMPYPASPIYFLTNSLHL